MDETGAVKRGLTVVSQLAEQNRCDDDDVSTRRRLVASASGRSDAIIIRLHNFARIVTSLLAFLANLVHIR